MQSMKEDHHCLHLCEFRVKVLDIALASGFDGTTVVQVDRDNQN
jgi:hypothetical protein